MVDQSRTLRPALISALALAAAYEVFLAAGFSDKTLEGGAPWQDDPYHAWISLAVFAVPALLAVTVLRVAGAWLPWGRSGATGRARDLVRAGLVLTAFGAATAVVCWLAVLLRADRGLWDGATPWWVGALALLTVPLPVVGRLGVRALRSLPEQRDADWVGDVLPAPLAAWVRRHDREVFLAASVVAAVGIIGALALGEGWTDPLLIGWALAVEVTCYYAFCVVTNAILGFVERPVRDRRTEHAVVIGSLAFQVAVALHGQLTPLAGVGPPDGVGRLVQMTVGPGLLVFAVAYVVLRLRPMPSGPARPAR